MRGLPGAGLCLASVLLLVSFSQAQETVQDLWYSPPSPDFSTAITIGDMFEISWDTNLTNSFAIYAPSADVTSVDLWITDYTLHVYAERIAARQNLNAINSLWWRVEVPQDELLATNQWVFRFLPQGVDYSSTAEQISSPGIYIHNQSTSAVTTTSSSSTPTPIPTTIISTVVNSASSTTATTNAAGDPTSNTPASETTGASHGSSGGGDDGGGLSSGAKAGIAVGAVAGCALLLGLGWHLARRFGGSKNSNNNMAPPNRGSVPPEYSSTLEVKPPSPANGPYQPVPTHQYHPYAELEHHGPAVQHELPANDHHR